MMNMPAPQVLFRRFGDSSLDFALRLWIGNVDDRLTVEGGRQQEIDRRFREAGIVITFPQRDPYVHSVDRLAGSKVGHLMGPLAPLASDNTAHEWREGYVPDPT